jgi:hypothetical protein
MKGSLWRSRVVGITTLAVLGAGSLSAQAQPEHKTGGNEGKVPLGWKIRADAGTDTHGGKDTLSFVQMTPGYHVTTGPGAIMWAPDSAATGAYSVDATIFLFPTKGRDQEGYGIFVGGQDLDTERQRYTYFLLRNDGKYLIKQRQGAKTTVLKDWTALPAIKVQAGADAMRNDLRIVAGATSVSFLVNGTEAASLPRGQVAPDGIFGLRLNHAVNAHVSKVSRGK